MEKEPKSFETKSERVPTYEEIHSALKKLIRGKYKEVRGLEDEQGNCMLEVIIPGEKEGERTQYEYNRKGKYEGFRAAETEIHIVYYKDGVPIGGELVAKFVNGKWELI